MSEIEVRHRKEDLCPFGVLRGRVASIDGLPTASVRPLAALIRSSGVETGPYLSEIRGHLRRNLRELLTILDQRNQAHSDEASRARVFSAAILADSSPIVRRIDIVAPAIAVLFACGCRMKEAVAFTAQLYPIAGWQPVEAKTVEERFYAEAPAELKGKRNEHHDRIRAELERIAEDLELDD